MEGITGYPFRNTFQEVFGGVDRYYSPFLSTNQTLHFKKKELRDVDPENNRSCKLIPQVMSNDPEQFCWALQLLGDMGYREVNLNLGCPSATVVTRHRGAGMLEDLERLDRFFDAVFQVVEKESLPAVSLKTRIGMGSRNQDMDEAKALDDAARLTAVFNRYPFAEIIIHPRLREDYYNGTPHLEVFAQMYEELKAPVCYNGDVFSLEDIHTLEDRFPDLHAIMIGRGFLRNPMLAFDIRNPESNSTDTKTIRLFLDRLYDNYRREMADDRQVLFKMKELWSYLQVSFPESEKTMKKLRKATTREEYEAFLREIMT